MEKEGIGGIGAGMTDRQIEKFPGRKINICKDSKILTEKVRERSSRHIENFRGRKKTYCKDSKILTEKVRERGRQTETGTGRNRRERGSIEYRKRTCIIRDIEIGRNHPSCFSVKTKLVELFHNWKAEDVLRNIVSIP